MKRFFFLIVLFSPFLCSAQWNLSQRAFVVDTSYQKQFLFPEDSAGNILFMKVIKCELDANSILNNSKKFASEIKSRFSCGVNDYFVNDNSLTFTVQLPVGKDVYTTPVGAFSRDISKVKFKLTIEVKEKRFRYTLTDFYTHRRMIRGEALSEGQSNILHFQRYSALLKERKAYSKKSTKLAQENMAKKDKEIIKEKAQYEAEYKSVLLFIDFLEKSCSKSKSSF